MTIREIKTKTTQYLIEFLISTASCEKITKNLFKTATTICVELKQRGVISDAFALFKCWRG